MKIAIISDLHLGDSESVMAYYEKKIYNGKEFYEEKLGEKYDKFKEIVKNNLGDNIDYLVLLGDILDFAVESYDKAYRLGKFFFKQLQNDNIAKEIIYIPGNHDFDIWHTVEYEVNVINRIKKGEEVRPFKMSVPGIIDCRTNSKHKFIMPGVRKRKKENLAPYGSLFLDSITGIHSKTNFNFVYPNLYFITDKESILITHGQYLQPYWSFLGEQAKYIFGNDVLNNSNFGIKDVVATNFPLSQLGSSGTGQAGKLTNVVDRIVHDVEDKDFTYVSQAFDRVGEEIHTFVRKKKGWFFAFLEKIVFKHIKKILLKELPNVSNARFQDEFANQPEVKNRMLRYYSETVEEINKLKENYNIDIPLPDKLIFGHTHQPIKWESHDAPHCIPEELGKKFKMFNTGGWLDSEQNGKKEFCGAEVFMYSDEKGFFSVSV